MIIFCNACDACGYKSSEVKGAGGISPQGRRISVRVSEQADLRLTANAPVCQGLLHPKGSPQPALACRRDVIKAESAALSVPELDLEVTTGVFGGLVTTVEGLVVAVRCVLAGLGLDARAPAADLTVSGACRDSLQRMHAFQLGDSAVQVSLAS